MRLRFAPSPTGALHLGGARTALFNLLAARHHGGAFLLRVEDTDRERSTPENVAQIMDALAWLGLEPDEPAVFQSDRAERHREVIAQLLRDGRAYRSTATGDDVKAFKAQHGADRGFRGEDEGEGAVRLRVPDDDGAVVLRDLVRGDVRFAHRHLDDPVVARADGSPLYNLAVAVDDLDMEVTHVVRGDDHISNTPKQLLVLEALDAPQPIHAHLPLIHGPDGKKLSKRHGAASVQELRDAGLLPEAVVDGLALLGWGPPDEDYEALRTLDELASAFELGRVSASPARFDEVKLRHRNGRWIRRLDAADLAGRVARFTGRTDDGRLRRAVAISQEKVGTLADFEPLAGALLDGPSAIDEKARRKWLADDGVATLREAREALAATEDWSEPSIEAALAPLVAARDGKAGKVYQPIRVALTGTTVSPGIFESLALVGRAEALARIDAVST